MRISSILYLFVLLILFRSIDGVEQITNEHESKDLQSLCSLSNYGEFYVSGIQTFTMNNRNIPIKRYQIKNKNRTEYVRAVINEDNVKRRGTSITTQISSYVKEIGKKGDVPGYIIDYELGGIGDKIYNIFPKYPYTTSWSRQSKQIRDYILDTKQPVEIVVQLYYPNRTSTRPNKLIYRAAYNNACYLVNVMNP